MGYYDYIDQNAIYRKNIDSGKGIVIIWHFVESFLYLEKVEKAKDICEKAFTFIKKHNEYGSLDRKLLCNLFMKLLISTIVCLKNNKAFAEYSEQNLLAISKQLQFISNLLPHLIKSLNAAKNQANTTADIIEDCLYQTVKAYYAYKLPVIIIGLVDCIAKAGIKHAKFVYVKLMCLVDLKLYKKTTVYSNYMLSLPSIKNDEEYFILLFLLIQL